MYAHSTLPFRLLSLFSLLSACRPAPVTPLVRQQNFPNPEPCTGNCTFIHDPAVIKRDGTYYRFSTNGNIAVATADHLTGPWTYQGAMLPNGSSIEFAYAQEMWAPDVSLVDDTYYAFYAVSKIGLQNSTIGVATSPSLDVGTWTEHGAVNIPHNSSYNLIDPNLFQKAPGQPYYFTFGSFWDDILQTQLDPSTGFTQQLPNTKPVQRAYNSTYDAGTETPSVTEGSYQFWLPDPLGDGTAYFYLFFSSGACCDKAFDFNAAGSLAAPGDEYKVMVCRATSPTGPFVDKNGRNCLTHNGGTMILGSHDDVYAPGGQGVFEEDDGRIVMYYHYVKPSVGYAYEDFFFGFNYLDFSIDGWPRLVASA